MTGDLADNKPTSSRAVIDAFLEKHAVARHSGGRGRLIFALDATASRQHCWDLATSLTTKMFKTVGGLPLDVQPTTTFASSFALQFAYDRRYINSRQRIRYCLA
jgi:hypothetical protein